MSANDKVAATFGPGRTTPTLETRIAEILSAHDFRIKEEVGAHVGVKTIVCNCGNRYGLGESHRAHQAAALAPVIAEAKAEALRKAADKFQTGDWFNVIQGNAHVKIGNGQRVTDWLRARADKLVTE